MPGRDYAHAFALLDQSLRDSVYLKPSTAPVSQPSLESDDDAAAQATDPWTSAPLVNGTSFTSHPFIQGQPSSFPPTPPLSSPTHFQRALPSKDDGSPSYLSNGSGLTTPTNPQSLPTPETTPPRLQRRLSPEFRGQFLAHSPNADSFKTAQEDQSSNGELDGDSHLDLYDSSSGEAGSWPKSRRTLELQGLGMDVLGNGHKTWPPLRHRADFSDFSALGRTLDWGIGNGDGDGNHVENWDAEKMRNVTLRRKPREKRDDDNNSIPLLMRGLSLRGDLDSEPHIRQISKEKRAVAELSPISDDSSVVQNLYDLEMKRLSGTSGSSTVVEAVVIDHTPPPRKRKLRHVSKTESLREESSPRLQHDSSTSEDTPSKVMEISKTRDRYSTGSVQSVIAPARSLRRRNESIPLRPLTAPTEQIPTESVDSPRDQRRVVSDPLRISALSFEDVTPPPPSASPVSLAADDFHDASSTAPQDEAPPVAAPRNLFEFDSYSPPQMPGSFPRQLSYDELMAGAESANRESFAPSDLSLRQLSLASPRSIKSETTENFEINEAAAVQFSSHTNNSLLVIHHTTSNEALRRHTVANPTTGSPRPEEGKVITLETTSPNHSQRDITLDVNSPLQNPRAAPEPPTVAIIPPTHAGEMDGADDDDSDVPTLTQQTSLLGRARRYSESFIQPISGSLRRTRRITSKRRSQSNRQTERDQRLHPNWQPKSNPVNVSGGEHGDTGVEGLPIDNMATSMGEQDSPEKWRRMGSLRGFLIGNTLGLQRGPTNRRRHVVTLPANKRRMQPLKGYPTGTEHVSVRDSAKRSGTGKKVRRRAGARAVFLGWRERMFQKGQGRERKLRDEKAAKLKANIGWPNSSTDTTEDTNDYSQ